MKESSGIYHCQYSKYILTQAHCASVKTALEAGFRCTATTPIYRVMRSTHSPVACPSSVHRTWSAHPDEYGMPSSHHRRWPTEGYRQDDSGPDSGDRTPEAPRDPPWTAMRLEIHECIPSLVRKGSCSGSIVGCWQSHTSMSASKATSGFTPIGQYTMTLRSQWQPT